MTLTGIRSTKSFSFSRSGLIFHRSFLRKFTVNFLPERIFWHVESDAF